MKIPPGSTISVDLDGTLCELVHFSNFKDAPPILSNLRTLNKLYEMNCEIIIFTARPWGERLITEYWLSKHNVPYHYLVMGKVKADFYLDQSSLRMEEIEYES